MKILITGGAGFIGSATIRHLIEHTDHAVVNLDKLTYAANLESLAPVEKSAKYHFEKADICDGIRVREILNNHQPDAVMNLAAESHVDRSIDGAADFVQTNLVGTYELLEATRDYWQSLDAARADAFRLLHISTDEVFGDLDDDPANRFTESTPYQPSSPYAATKAGSDHLVRAWGRTYGLPVVVTNCSNNYGPYQFPEKLIPHVILNAVAGKPLPVYGAGDQIRDWLHVDDHASALIRVLTEGQLGSTYNIGASSERKNIDVVKTICRILSDLGESSPTGKPFAEQITFVADRPGHDVRYAINPEKIMSELGWAPEVSFEQGLEQTITWYLSNRGWWEKLLSGDYNLERIGTATGAS